MTRNLLRYGLHSPSTASMASRSDLLHILLACLCLLGSDVIVYSWYLVRLPTVMLCPAALKWPVLPNDIEGAAREASMHHTAGKMVVHADRSGHYCALDIVNAQTTYWQQLAAHNSTILLGCSMRSDRH